MVYIFFSLFSFFQFPNKSFHLPRRAHAVALPFFRFLGFRVSREIYIFLFGFQFPNKVSFGPNGLMR